MQVNVWRTIKKDDDNYVMIVVQNSQTIPLLLGEKFTISKIKNDHAIVFLQAKKCSWHYEEHLVTGCSLHIKFKADDSSIIPVRLCLQISRDHKGSENNSILIHNT